MQLAPLLAEITWQGLRSVSDIALLAGFAVALILVILLYLRDAQRLHPLWTLWLLVLRLTVFVALVIILLNPRDRTRNTEQVPSRVILLVDTSSSMGFREESGSAVAGQSARKPNRTRAQAVYDLLRQTPLLAELGRHHQLSLFTFDKQLNKQPLLVQGGAEEKTASPESSGRQSSENKTSGEKSSDSANGSSANPLSPLLKPEGLETRLGEALQELLRLQKGRSLSAVVVISDGQHNAGIDPAAANIFARNNKIRLYTVGVGSTVPPVNVRVADIEAPNEVNRGSPFDVTVYVQGERLGGKQVQVKLRYKPQGADDKELRDAELREDEAAADASVLVLPNTSRSVPKTFHLKPLPPGKYEYVVELQPLFQVDEFRKDDNTARHRLNVIERNLGVLIIAGGPMRDYRFVRNMLFRHKNIDLDIWLQTVDDQTVGHVSQEADDILTQFPESFPTRPKALAEGYLDNPDSVHAIQYDVIIAFDPDWNSERLGLEGIRKVERWLAGQAGGLILIAGDVNTPLLATAPENDPVAETVRRFYPVVLSQSIVLDSDTKSDKPWPFQLTESARGVSFFKLAEEEEGNEEKPETPPNAGTPYPWNEFPGFYRCYPSEGKKAGAVVYSFFTDPAMEAVYESKPILFASQDYGVGRVLYFGTSEIWRLRDLDVDYYDRFWTKAVFDAAKRRLGRKSPFGNILLRKDEYFVGDNVSVEVNLLNLNNEPIQAESVRMDVLRPNGKVLDPPLKLLRDPNRPGFYVGNFTVREQGTYQLRVDNPEVPSRNRITAVVPVRFSQTESLNPIQNAELLDRLAEGTGGRYFGFAEFRRLFGSIRAAQEKLDELKQQGASAGQIREAEAVLQKAREPLIRYFPDAGYTLQVNEQVDPLWDSRWVIFLLVGALSVEWLTRKLLKLA